MSFRYILALNVGRDVSDDINTGQLDLAIRRMLSQEGFFVESIASAKSNIESFLPPRRSVVSVGMSLSGDMPDASHTTTLDRCTVTAIRDAAHRQWSVIQTIADLPRQGNGSARPSWFGDVTDIQRVVQPGGGQPGITVTNPTSSTVVQETTHPAITPGTVQPSGLVNAGSAAVDALAPYKTPLVIAGVIVGAGVAAYAIRSVK